MKLLKFWVNGTSKVNPDAMSNSSDQKPLTHNEYHYEYVLMYVRHGKIQGQ